MTNLTEFQNNLILDLQKEFTRLNPPAETPGRFSMATLKQNIDSIEAFKNSIYSFNKAMASELREKFHKQIDEFNKEFDPVNLTYGTNCVTKMFEDEYYLKNPNSTEISLFFEGDNSSNNGQLYMLFNTAPVSIETSSQVIRLDKITSLSWTKRSWLRRDESTYKKYFTLDEFVQEEKSFQLNIQAKYKHLTK